MTTAKPFWLTTQSAKHSSTKGGRMELFSYTGMAISNHSSNKATQFPTPIVQF